MAQRTGLPTIRDTCAFLCGFLAVYIPIIHKVFPDETDLHTALDLLQVTVCSLVVAADDVILLGD